MSDTADDMNALRQFRKNERDQNLPGRRDELRALANEGYEVRALDGDFSSAFHYRINNRLDIWPSRNRYIFVGVINGTNRSRTIHEPQTITELVHECLPLKSQEKASR